MESQVIAKMDATLQHLRGSQTPTDPQSRQTESLRQCAHRDGSFVKTKRIWQRLSVVRHLCERSIPNQVSANAGNRLKQFFLLTDRKAGASRIMREVHHYGSCAGVDQALFFVNVGDKMLLESQRPVFLVGTPRLA